MDKTVGGLDSITSKYFEDYEKLSEYKRRTSQNQKDMKKKVLNARKSQTAVEEYGPLIANAYDVEDIDVREYVVQECKEYLNRIKVTDEGRQQIVLSTQNQVEEDWYKLRRMRLTASNFGKIAKQRSSTDPVNLIRAMLYSGNLSTKEIEYGKTHESSASTQYELEKGIIVQKIGLYVHKDFCWLGCSPDGIIDDPQEGKGLIEIKCISIPEYQDQLISSIVTSKKNFYLKKVNDALALKQNHDYYFQVQGQLEVMDLNFCDFVVYNEVGIFVERIYRSKGFWKDKIFDKLKRFFFLVDLPELALKQIKLKKMPINLSKFTVEELYNE